MTQPKMYQDIGVTSTAPLYAQISRWRVSQEGQTKFWIPTTRNWTLSSSRLSLRHRLLLARTFPIWSLPAAQQNTGSFGGKTAISRETLRHIADAFGKAPERASAVHKLKKQRVEMGRTGQHELGYG